MNRNVFAFFIATWLALALVGLATEGQGLAEGAIVLLPLVLLSALLCDRLDLNGECHSVDVFLVALVLRWVVAAGIHLLIYPFRPGLFAPDEIYYDFAARCQAEVIAGRAMEFPDLYLPGVAKAAAYCYYLFGYAPLLPKMLNGLLGAWTAVFTGLMARRVFSPAVARRAGYFAALFPSQVLWSSLLCKDAATLFGSQLALLSFMHLRERFRVWLVAVLAVALLFTASNRGYVVLFIAAAIAGSFFFSSSRNLWRNLALFTFMPLFLAIVIQTTDATSVFRGATDDVTASDRLELVRNGYTDQANSAINTEMIDTSTPLGMVAWVPIGISYFYLAPIPFLGTSIISLATSPEMLVWYFLIPGVLRGLAFSVRHRLRVIAPLMLYALVSTIGWSIVVTNVGTLYRYRSQVLFFPLILAASDQVRRRERDKQSESARNAALKALRPPPAPESRNPGSGPPHPTSRLCSYPGP